MELRGGHRRLLVTCNISHEAVSQTFMEGTPARMDGESHRRERRNTRREGKGRAVQRKFHLLKLALICTFLSRALCGAVL